MKNSVVAGLGLVSLLAGPAVAADLAVKAPVAKVSPVYNWTGCYGGANFGSQFTQSDWGVYGSDDNSGLVVGGQLGCNYQVSTWVFGVQGDADWSDASGTHTDTLTGATDEWKTRWLASVTGRFGYAWDRMLFYTKGGAAWINDKYTTYDTGNSASGTRDGWTVGGGFEYAITSNLTMFFEYDYFDFGTKAVGLTSVAGPVDIRDRDSVVKIGANWKFGW
jgi:outer membrane immunogenic protein